LFRLLDVIRKVLNVEYWIILLGLLSVFVASCDEGSHLKFFSTSSVHEPQYNCTVCHGERKKRGFSPPTRLIEGVPKLCYECHSDYTLSAPVLHHPITVGQCLFCHHAHSSRFEHLLKEPVPGLCYKCHAITNFTVSAPYVHVHPAVNQCMFCHEPHNSQFEYLLKEPEPKLCYQCHDMTDYTGAGHFVHGPVAAGRCLFCHDAHTSKNEYLLKGPEPELCYRCHDREEIEKIPAHITKLSYKCTGCHTAHTSSIKHLIKKELKEETK
jgi:predicted CXXCH cytochrome family protein